MFSSIFLFIIYIICYINVYNCAFYLPGVSPNTFYSNDEIPLYVNKLTSTITQLPYDYYTLPYCHDKLHKESENIGQILSGDRIESSKYILKMKKTSFCEFECQQTEIKKSNIEKFKWAIDNDYRAHMILDNLPIAMEIMDPVNPSTKHISRGVPVGFKIDNEYYIYNHLRFKIFYNDDEIEMNSMISATDQKKLNKDQNKNEIGGRIVGFQVQPFSINHHDQNNLLCQENKNQEQNQNQNQNQQYQILNENTNDIIFTYDVIWQYSSTPWAHRWDIYLEANPDDRIHWFSITNSTMIVLFLSVMVAMILIRTLKKDIAEYNDDSNKMEEAIEERGWKLIHADIFRPPQSFPMLFSVLTGTGTQLFMMSFATITFALLGFLSPANRGGLITAFILLFVFMGSFAGYYSSRIYKMFRGTKWKRNTLLTAFLYPTFVGIIFIIISICQSYEKSSAAIPIGTLITLIILWCGVSVPLVFLGSFFGYKKEIPDPPVRTNQIPRVIPEQPWYLSSYLMVIFGGILPFGAVSVELFFIMSALWLHQIYYIFGFLFIAILILIITCAEITIVLCYFQICHEDYRWWWRSFFSSGSCAFYLFLYSIWYYYVELNLDGFVPTLIYFGYMTVISATFFILTGSIGFFACYWFINKIYGSIKVD